jgi:hypothetical protein
MGTGQIYLPMGYPCYSLLAATLRPGNESRSEVTVVLRAAGKVSVGESQATLRSGRFIFRNCNAQPPGHSERIRKCKRFKKLPHLVDQEPSLLVRLSALSAPLNDVSRSSYIMHCPWATEANSLYQPATVGSMSRG